MFPVTNHALQKPKGEGDKQAKSSDAHGGGHVTVVSWMALVSSSFLGPYATWMESVGSGLTALGRALP